MADRNEDFNWYPRCELRPFYFLRLRLLLLLLLLLCTFLCLSFRSERCFLFARPPPSLFFVSANDLSRPRFHYTLVQTRGKEKISASSRLSIDYVNKPRFLGFFFSGILLWCAVVYTASSYELPPLIMT